MKVYLVGGAVRDELLGLPVSEKDYVVVGATVDEMLKKGYRLVGKDFPVFLHPKTNEEYALARVERKISLGYTGFDVDASPKVTLEEDLLRRDLTINAIAKSEEDGKLVDPFNGIKDLEKKILRHVSQAFVEDPVRILRIARFAARFKHLGFQMAPETLDLMKSMVVAGEVNALVPERVWKEWERAIQEKHPEEFFLVLAVCQALNVLIPEFNIANAGLKALSHAAELSAPNDVRFAVSFYPLSLEQVEKICSRYRIPNQYRELVMLVTKYYPDYRNAKTLSAMQLLTLMQATDAFRREERFELFLLACEILAETLADPVSTDWFNQVCIAAKEIDMKSIDKNAQGKDIGELIKLKRLAAIENSPSLKLHHK